MRMRNTYWLLKPYILALLIMTVLRMLLYVTIDYDFASDISLSTKLTAFVKGLWFDNVIACYIIALPLLIALVCDVCAWTSRWVTLFFKVWCGTLFSLAFAISAANIPYFCYFFQPLNTGILQWFGYAGTTAGMVVGEASYWPPICYGVLSIIIFLLYLIRKPAPIRENMSFSVTKFAGRLFMGIILAGLCFLGIRGRLGYNPIKVSQAYYCNDPFLNQLGINPTFNLLTSYIDDQRPENKRLSLMDKEESIRRVQQLLDREGIEGISPIARRVDCGEIKMERKNVVIILMESMSSDLLGKGQTPFLDSLTTQSWYFSNTYSAGNHTNHGMYATLYSWPAIMFRNLMKGTVIPHYSGLPTVLHDNGYHTMFFMTHESQYDNMNGFFRTNGFDDIYAQEDYPADKVANSFGVQDDFLYDYSVPVMNKVAAKGQPFFTVLLSVSNHPPFVIPDYFKPVSKDIEQQIVEYADWSIRKFFMKAKQQSWYDNTIFVLLGDHGKLLPTPECELPESYNHVPLIIYGKGIIPARYSSFALQEDVAPTLLGLLGMSYTQNDFGMNLLNEQRDCVFYTGDQLIAARDSTHLFLYNPSERSEMLYKVKGRSKVERTKNSDTRFDYLKGYVFSMLQAAETLVDRKQTVTK